MDLLFVTHFETTKNCNNWKVPATIDLKPRHVNRNDNLNLNHRSIFCFV